MKHGKNGLIVACKDILGAVHSIKYSLEFFSALVKYRLLPFIQKNLPFIHNRNNQRMSKPILAQRIHNGY